VEGRVDISDSTGAGDGGTTEQLRYFTDAVLSNRPIDLPAANFDEAIKTMIVAEKTLNASPVNSTLYQGFGLRTADSPHTHTHTQSAHLVEQNQNQSIAFGAGFLEYTVEGADCSIGGWRARSVEGYE
jgi:hypothetical protein